MKRAGQIHMSANSLAVLIADARRSRGWTGRMIDGDWFRFPLDGRPGCAATWVGGSGVLAQVAQARLAVLMLYRDDDRIVAVADGAWEGTPGALGRLAGDPTVLGEVVIDSGLLAILESREPGSFIPAEPRPTRGARDGLMICAVAPGPYRVCHESAGCERITIAPS